VSEALRTLREGARQLQRLHKDLYPPAFTRREWKGTVFARQTLGDDSKVELWYLAEHFLLSWNDWHGLANRYVRYFGESEQPFPTSWHRLQGKCLGLVSQLLRDEQLDDLVFESWMTTAAADALNIREEPSIEEVYHTIVQNHRRWSLMTEGRYWPAIESEEIARQGKIWPQSKMAAYRLNANLMPVWEDLGNAAKGELLFYLRNYRHANLVVSWLVKEPLDQNGMSALFRILSSEKPVQTTLDSFLTDLKNDDLRGAAGHVLERISSAIAEIGYDQFVDDVCSDDFHGGSDSPVGTRQINLIPSRLTGAPQPLLLAVSKGSKKRIGFPQIMREVRKHLIDFPVTRVVIVLCDYWSPEMLDEHIGDLRAHYGKGVRFLFLMVGTPSRVVAPVAVDLGLAP
jgi:hypothetical protein